MKIQQCVLSPFASLSQSLQTFSTYRTLPRALLTPLVPQLPAQTNFPERPCDGKFLVHVVNRLIGFRRPNLAHIQNVIMICALIGFPSFWGPWEHNFLKFSVGSMVGVTTDVCFSQTKCEKVLLGHNTHLCSFPQMGAPSKVPTCLLRDQIQSLERRFQPSHSQLRASFTRQP